MNSRIAAIAYALPERFVDNAQLSREFSDWSIEKIFEKTGIDRRWIAASEECASDLAVKAAQKLFAEANVNPSEIDFLLFCTQSPDYFLPTSACLIQSRLQLPITAGALDFNLGCSGFVYGLGLAKGLVETGQAQSVLLITAETYSKFIDPADRSVRTLFGDAGAAVLITASDDDSSIGPFLYGTDGNGAKNLIVATGGCRERGFSANPALYMNGSEVLTFTLSSVPPLVKELLQRTGNDVASIDLFIFHQANKFMLELLRKKCNIPREKFVEAYRDVGNTVSCTIPIALKDAADSGQLRRGMKVMLVGFGVGYSWSACLVHW